MQEWKDILVRGNDSELYEKYLKQFRDKENSVNSRLTTITKQLKKLNHIKQSHEIDYLIKEHLEVGEKYNSALSKYDKSDMTSYIKVDVKVRGINRPTSKSMDNVSKDILSLTEDKFKKIDIQVQENYQHKVIILLSIAALGLLALFVAGLSISRKYLNILEMSLIRDKTK